MGDAHMAMQARLMSQALRKLNRSLSYGDSTWWLKELEKITECWSSKGQKVAPVFYVVDLSEAGAAFACRESLKKDACLPGFVTLNRLSKEVVDARHQCLKCAMDLSMKHEYLPEDLQAMQTPFRGYLQEMLALVKREKAERESLGGLPLYQRTIP